MSRTLVLGHACAGLLCCSLFAAARAQPPRLLKVTPELGGAVDPATRELRFEFDQDMAVSGYSICGGGPALPTIRPKSGPRGPRWDGPRVFVLPVRLEPGHDYEFSLNCRSAQNFRSATGEQLAPTPIKFRAAAADPGRPPPEFDPVEALAILREAVEKSYAHIELHPVDWKARFDEFGPRLKAAKEPRDFARLAGELLSATGDLHAWVEAGGERFAAGQRRVDPNANPRLMKRIVPGWKAVTKNIARGRFDDGVGYLLIASWGLADEDVAAALDALAEWHDAPGAIIDVRFNAGGNERAAQQVAGCLFEVETPYARHRIRNPDGEGGFLPEVTRTVAPTVGRPTFNGRLAALIGPRCMSSCESFIQMMQQHPRARTFGAKTHGSSGNPKPIELGDGITCWLPSWVDLTLAGQPIEGRGIEPDVAIEFDKPAEAEDDPVLAAARRWIVAPAKPD